MAEDTLIMWSVAQIAVRDKVSKQAVSKAVKKLIDDKPDTPVERDGQGRVMQISLADYDFYRQRFVNPAKAKAEIRSPVEPSTPNPTAGDGFDEARRQSEWMKVRGLRIRHQEQMGQLVRKDGVDHAVRIAGQEIQAIVKRLPNRADDLALAVSKEGVHGARVLLRTIAFELGNEIADGLAKLAATAPATDDEIEGEEL